jgi:Niemann-Pick C1 protein
VAVTSFWNDTKSVFTDNIQSDGEAIAALSMLTYPDGTPVESEAVFGKARKDENLTLTSVVSYLISINLPETSQSEDFETPAIENIKALSATWAAEAGNPFRLELFAVRSFSDEFTRAIVTDIPLVPIVFVIMSIFTCVVFFQFDWVFSRSLLGFGAVVSVLLAIMSGYGLLFIFGIPFTSMTQILPFIMFGIGKWKTSKFSLLSEISWISYSLFPPNRFG